MRGEEEEYLWWANVGLLNIISKRLDRVIGCFDFGYFKGNGYQIWMWSRLVWLWAYWAVVIKRRLGPDLGVLDLDLVLVVM